MATNPFVPAQYLQCGDVKIFPLTEELIPELVKIVKSGVYSYSKSCPKGPLALDIQQWSEAELTRFYSNLVTHSYLPPLPHLKWNKPFIITHQDQVVGLTQLKQHSRLPSACTTTIIATTYQGKGIGAKSRACLLSQALLVWNMDSVVAGIRTGNTASIALVKKLNYKFLQDSIIDGDPFVVYKITRDDWAKIKENYPVQLVTIKPI